MDKRGEEEEQTTSKAHKRTRSCSSSPHQQEICSVFTIAFASGMRPHIWYLHRDNWKQKRTSTSTPEQLILILLSKSGTCHTLEATRCKNSLRIERRRFTELPNSSTFARTEEIGQLYITNDSVVDGGRSTFFMQRRLRAKEFSKFKRTSNSQRSLEDRASDRNRSIRICRTSGERS